MKSKKLLLVISLIFVSAQSIYAQLDSIFDQGTYRTFIVHTPTGYSASNAYPIVMSLHGLNSNAAQEELYSQFDVVADSEGFIVVYPNGINNSWSIGTSTDVNFISHLTDTIRSRYSTNTCLFFNGISDGGFMTYKLACALPQHITAIGVVSGNMSTILENTCVISSGLPVMHFHGTADPLVSYNGTPGIPPVETTIQWWVNSNHCGLTPDSTVLPDIVTSDSCNVIHYYYSGGTNGSVVSFYKIINGGHTWPGAVPVPQLGFTNEDINASALMGSFFKSFCQVGTGVASLSPEEEMNVKYFPNPVQNSFTVEWSTNFDLVLSDVTGRKAFEQKNCNNKTEIDCRDFPDGIYFLQATNGKSICNQKLIVSK